ncbi:receptor-like serine threonine- kinase SD1-8 [Olea europaea subsp. europaea]|uniref:Receptor-like serine/threonine-protein kinase n=1 Tax=Olea europaea subsp. europaea TaxID=158383 RepID=A0A8S0PFR2_OLEEU|nr:receptor-like serine threonine- kinase SD1-8 [Olea europaea subsp. europaea]
MWQTKRHRGTGRSLCFTLCILLWFMEGRLCLGSDILSEGDSLSGSDTLISENGTFEMGFFCKKTGTSDNLYLGIWYKDFKEKTIVWVANRRTPLRNMPSSRLEISEDGIVLFEGFDKVWSSGMSSIYPGSFEAVLLDIGNLIVRDVSKPSIILWQSFDHPTDTWLPGAKLGFHKVNNKRQRLLSSWKSADDPSSGMFSVELSPDETDGYILKWNMSDKYWWSGPWNGTGFGSVPEMSFITNFSLVSNENETYYTYKIVNPSVLTMLRLMPSGMFQQFTSFKFFNNWDLLFSQPRNQNAVIASCGAFGIFSENSSTTCSCLKGFSSISAEPIPGNDWFSGCGRKNHLQCENSTSGKGKEDGYLKISTIKLPANSNVYLAQNDKQCKSACTQNCTCTAYAFSDRGCLVWEGALYDVRQLSNNDNSKQDLYLKVSNSDLPDTPGKRKILEVAVAVLVPLVVLFSGGFIGCFYTRKIKQKGNKSSGQDLLSFDFSYSGNRTDDVTNRLEAGNEDFNLPMFSYASVSKATDDFSAEAKLGEGGFGAVYKGKLMNGQEIAVKRLSQRSAQGFIEFRNEIELIAKLQHRNLVRLLGCSVDQDESILIYEYLPNKSLDFFLFDSKKQNILEWATRVRIIEGIAQGLVYLHEYSRLRIVHRDLKASNILLDSEMNPKISDFGMARMFGGNNSQANTQRIVGTYGYMAPEYAMEGFFSIKSDVFSFGVLVLEILSGKKNTGFYQKDSLNLLGHTWELWTSNRGVTLLEPALGSPKPSLLRYINLGLLCVQENPNDRPTMSTVISMLKNEFAPLPAPKQPAFTLSRSLMNTASSSNSTGGNYSVNSLTVSMVEPR